VLHAQSAEHEGAAAVAASATAAAQAPRRSRHCSSGRSPRASIVEKDRLTTANERAHAIRSLFARICCGHSARTIGASVQVQYQPTTRTRKCSPRSRSAGANPSRLACHGESDAHLSRGRSDALGTMSEHDRERGSRSSSALPGRPRRRDAGIPLPLEPRSEGRPHAGDCPARARGRAGFVGGRPSWRRSRRRDQERHFHEPGRRVASRRTGADARQSKDLDESRAAGKPIIPALVPGASFEMLPGRLQRYQA